MVSKISFETLDLMDALDLAILIEKEAEERYREFAKMVGSQTDGDAGHFFELMAGNEAKHGADLCARRKQLFGAKPMRVTARQIEDVEAPEYDKPRAFMSVRHALEVALASEVKAQKFFENALKHITDKEVSAVFLELRDEEIDHQRLVKNQMEKTDPSLEPVRKKGEIDEPPGL